MKPIPTTRPFSVDVGAGWGRAGQQNTFKGHCSQHPQDHVGRPRESNTRLGHLKNGRKLHLVQPLALPQIPTE